MWLSPSEFDISIPDLAVKMPLQWLLNPLELGCQLPQATGSSSTNSAFRHCKRCWTRSCGSLCQCQQTGRLASKPLWRAPSPTELPRLSTRHHLPIGLKQGTHGKSRRAVCHRICLWIVTIWTVYSAGQKTFNGTAVLPVKLHVQITCMAPFSKLELGMPFELWSTGYMLRPFLERPVLHLERLVLYLATLPSALSYKSSIPGNFQPYLYCFLQFPKRLARKTSAQMRMSRCRLTASYLSRILWPTAIQTHQATLHWIAILFSLQLRAQ